MTACAGSPGSRMTDGVAALPAALADTANRLLAGSLGLAERGAEGLRLTASGNDPLAALAALAAMVELANKGEVYLLVRGVGLLLGICPGEFPLPLLQLVGRAYDLGPFPALWAIEGLGHDYSHSYWQQGLVPHRLLSDPRDPVVPAPSLCMLNAGLGLSLAQWLLDVLPAAPLAAAVRRVVAEITGLCRDNARPGYLGAAYESLGLVTRLFHAPLVPAVDRAVREVSPDARSFYWHGVGRSFYFVPESFLPFSLWPTYQSVCRAAPDGLARANAIAGLTWGALLVNQRQPQVLCSLLVGPHGEEVVRMGLADAFVNGIASSIVMRCATTPGAPFIASFCDYVPADPATARLWDRLVRRPCAVARDILYPQLAAANRLGEVFHYQPWQALG